MNDADWELVGTALRAGQYNLLIGAGVSLDSQSGIAGENCPSAGTLRQLLEDRMPRVRKGSSLNRLYRTMNQKEKDELITRRFTSCKPGPSVNAIANFRWKRIFTLNVDDALETAYDEKPLPVQDYKLYNYCDPYESIRDIRITPIIHLHGHASRPDDGYIFDIKEYMSSINDHNIWARMLASLIRTEPFIVLGSSLEEPDITYFMSDRFNVLSRSDRAPSVLVEPFPDAGTEADCQEYKMSLFSGTSISFLEKLDMLFPVRPSVRDSLQNNLGDVAKIDADPTALSEFHSDFERVPTHTIDGTDGGTNFAYGHQPTWLDIQNDRDIPRRETAFLLSQFAKPSRGLIPIVTGGAGAGKTTLLKRAAWNLSQSDATCFWLRSIGRIRVQSALKILGSVAGDVYIFIDNLADHINEVVQLRHNLRSKNIRIIGAERTYRVNHITRIAGEARISAYPLGVVGDLKTKLLSAYKNYGLLALPTKDTNAFPLEQELIAIACCRILNNFEPLSAIVDRSLRDAPRDVECYVFAALASHCFRIGVEYDIISAQFPNYQVDIQADDEGALPLKLTQISENEFVTPQNDAFSDTILRRFANQQSEQMFKIFCQLAHAIRPRVSVRAIIDGDACARIASRLFDFDEVVKPLLGLELAGRFYDESKREWDWNSRYWHQIAQYRLELAASADDRSVKLAQSELAVQHARFAKTIERKHQFTMTTIGRVIFGKARITGVITAAEIDEAIVSLSEAMRLERDKGRISIHPYMILFKGLFEAINIGAVLSPNQRSKVRSLLDDAAALFGSDRDLNDEALQLIKVL